MYLSVFKNYILPYFTAQLKNKTIMKQGDILTNKEGGQRKILGICGEVFIMSGLGDFTIVTDIPWTKKELIRAGYEIPRKKFVPQDGKNAWYITIDGELGVSKSWNTSFDQALIDLGNCFETQEEAEKVAEEIKKIYKNAHVK